MAERGMQWWEGLDFYFHVMRPTPWGRFPPDVVKVLSLDQWRRAYVEGARVSRKTGHRGRGARLWAWRWAWAAMGVSQPPDPERCQ